MKKVSKHPILYLIFISLSTLNCKEEIDIETISGFEKLLVIQANITDEFKFQEINLSSTYGLNEEHATGISNANVEIIDDNQKTINFYESSVGKYKSSIEFALQPNVIYTLHITTSDGKSYKSTPTTLPNSTQIDNINISRETNNLGIKGVSIAVNSFNSSGGSRYYRYEYEETYKIIAPYWSQFDLEAEIGYPYRVFDSIPKSKEVKICYKTNYSNHILQKETNGLAEDKVSNFTVRFIPNNNPIISHRYSILVKQYVQSYEAFSYFQILDKITGSDNIFSQSQPGFISGNVFKVDDTSEKVIGFFETSSVSIKRAYFNYADLFPGETRPPYFIDCVAITPTYIEKAPSDLHDIVVSGNHVFYLDRPGPTPVPPYILVPKACGYCTELGSNIKPSFWED